LFSCQFNLLDFVVAVCVEVPSIDFRGLGLAH